MRNLPIAVSTDELQTDHRLGAVEHICELRKSGIVLYGIFTELLRMVYSDTDGRLVGTPNVTWKAGGTALWIDSELRWEDQHPEVRPAIYVQLGQLQSADYIPGTCGRIQAANRFGERSYALKKSGTVTFMHVASTAGESCALADNTEYALQMLQEAICRDFCFTQFEQAGRIPLEKLPKEATDKYASGVIFNYEFEDSWIVKEECPILKTIDILPIVYGDSLKEMDRQKTVNRANIDATRTFKATSQR